MSKPRDAPQPKIGAGHVSAMARQGLKELRGALYNDSSVAQQPEYGIWGTKTPGEVAEARRDDGRDLSDEATGSRSVLDERMQQAQRREDRDAGSKGLEKE